MADATTPPRLTELALFTADVAGVTAFYERVLGVAPADRSEQHATFQLGELVLRIHVAVEPSPGDPPADDHVAFTVDGLDARAGALAAAGLSVDGPRELPWGRSAYLRDPDGRLVELT
ncbi:MAG TPA: VOC family protein [Gaiellaceae bacterium]|nr:VOC family protein [Gaiellaceae bacterium]